MRTYLGLFLLGALFALLLTPAITALGRRLHAYGRPHQGEEAECVPRMGGLAIFAAIFAAWGALLLVPNDVRARFLSEWPTLIGFMAPTTLVLVLGVYDDLKGLTPWRKLMIETLAASLVWCSGFRIVTFPFTGFDIHSPLLSFLLTVLWIVAVTNAFNLIDGLDGLAAGVAFFVTLSVFIVSLIQGNHFICIITITLAGALMGFLRFNFSPAKIFLGDAGSLSLGFVLAALAVHTSQKRSTLLAVIVPFAAFGLPLLDMSLTVVRRFLGGRPVFLPDRDHIHHRLLQRKETTRGAVFALYALAALFSLGSLLIIRSTGNLVALVAVLVGVSGWFLTRQVQYEELSELNLYLSRAVQSHRRVLANQVLIRKTSKKLENISSLEESWPVLVRALEALDFDGVACRLEGRQYGSLPLLNPWARADGEGRNECWRISIPLLCGEKCSGELELRRSLGKDHLLFEFSSLLRTLIPPFEKQLLRRLGAEEADSAIQYGLAKSSVMHAGLLATGKKA